MNEPSPLVKNFKMGDLYYGLNNARTLLHEIRTALGENNKPAGDIPITVDQYNKFCRVPIADFEKTRNKASSREKLLSKLDEYSVTDPTIRDLYIQHLDRLMKHYDNQNVADAIMQFSKSKNCSDEDKLTARLCLLGLVIAYQDDNPCKVHFETAGIKSDGEYSDSFTTTEFNFVEKHLLDGEHIIKYKHGNDEMRSDYNSFDSPDNSKKYSRLLPITPVTKPYPNTLFQTDEKVLNPDFTRTTPPGNRCKPRRKLIDLFDRASDENPPTTKRQKRSFSMDTSTEQDEQTRKVHTSG